MKETNSGSLVWSPDSQYVAGAYGGDSERVRVWEAETGNLVVELSRQRPSDAQGIASAPRSIAWRPDGQIIATEATLGLEAEILLWDADFSGMMQEPQRLNVAGEVRHIVRRLMWSHSGNMLLTSGSDNLQPVIGEPLYFTQTMSYVLDVGENNILLSIPEPMMGWGPNDTRVISGGPTLTIWELSSGNALATFDKHTSSVRAVAWNYFIPVIASADVEGHIYFWNPDTGISYEISEMNSSILDLSWKPNSGTLALAVEDEVIIRAYDFDM
jgi:WD40 repeat protein